MSHSRHPMVAGLAASLALVAVPLASAPAHADASVPLPSADPFYAYSGATPLAEQPPGTVLGKRAVTLDLNGTSVPAEQLLYRTKDEQGRPSVTVTTVANPAGAAKGIVGYLSYYDGLGDKCDPSYTLQGGGAGPGDEATVIGLLISSGYAVTVPDFEGETLDWAAGDEAGWDTLDAVRATENDLGLPATTKVGLFGYSGGSIAGDWASELAPTYAPELTLVGTAIGGVPANLAHLMSYVDGSIASAGAIPAAMVSLSRAFGIDFSQYESARGLADTEAIKDDCIADFTAAESGVHIKDLVKPEYADFLQIPAVASIVTHLQMGTAGRPTTPMMILNGKSDDTGDGIMVTADVKALADTYCSQGLPVQYIQLDGENHLAAGTTFVFDGLSYLAPLFAGAKPPSTCPSKAGTGGGGSTPVKATPSAIRPTVRSSSHGRRDIIVVTAPQAVGATVRIVRLGSGHRTVVGHGTIGSNGRARIAVRDHNGRQVTRYRALLGATATTLAGVTRTISRR
jgi:hypothetical protein